jgi:hypothetical protein
MSGGENPELAGILLAQAQQGQKLAEIDAGLAHAEGKLGELQTVLVGVRGTLAAQGEILDGLAEVKAEVASLRGRVNLVFPPERNDGSEFYDPPPSVRIWQLKGEDRTKVIVYLSEWVDKVFAPTFGHIARKIPPCWNEHPLCITVVDVLCELHKVLWCQPVRLAGTLSGQAEFLTRLAPALAELMAAERKGCEHELSERDEKQQSGNVVIKYGRSA